MRAATTTTDTTTADNPQPLHWLTQTRTYGDGLAALHTMPGHHTTAADAQRHRAARLRAAGTPFTAGAGWVEYTEEPPAHVERCTVRLAWSDEPPTGAGRFTPDHLARSLRPRVGQVVRVECDDTTGGRVVGDVLADRVVRLGCGCWRLEGDRPGPRTPGSAGRVHVLTGCGSHPCGILPATGEPTPAADLAEPEAPAEPVAEVAAEVAEPDGYGSAEAYAVGDRVGVRWGWQGTESAGVVAEVTHAPDCDVVYTVNRPNGAPAYVGAWDMRPDTTPAPQVGQVWACDSPAVSVTVHGVQPGGLVAETDRGAVILSAPHWRLSDASDAEPTAEPVAEVVPAPVVDVFADLLAARR